MAYSNWGAWVLRDGKPRHDREDVTVWNDHEDVDVAATLAVWNNLWRLGPPKDHDGLHHAVLGDSYVRFCAYKDRPRLYVLWLNGKIDQLDVGVPHDDMPDSHGAVQILHLGDWLWRWEHDDNRLHLTLTEPGGVIWTATSGFMYGAGFD